jgi:DNA-directed RNA polymerase specialized sigma24 family protein
VTGELDALASQIRASRVSWFVNRYGADDSDAALLAASLSDPAAFARFYDRYEKAMAGFFLARVGTPEVAADLTAEVFANALSASGRYRERAPTAAAWMFTIARNTLRESVRRGQVEDAARRRLGSGVVELSDATLERLEAPMGSAGWRNCCSACRDLNATRLSDACCRTVPIERSQRNCGPRSL